MSDTTASLSEDASEKPVHVDIGQLFNVQPIPPKFWVEDLVPADVVTLLAAHGGTGKTTLAAHVAVCIAMGIDFLGKKTAQAKVLFYSAEDDKDQLQRVFRAVCVQLNVDPIALAPHLVVVDASMAQHILFAEGYGAKGVRLGMPTDAYTDLREHIRASGAQVVILDNSSDVFAADENNRSQVKGFIRCLVRLIRKVNGAVFLLSHVD